MEGSFRRCLWFSLHVQKPVLTRPVWLVACLRASLPTANEWIQFAPRPTCESVQEKRWKETDAIQTQPYQLAFALAMLELLQLTRCDSEFCCSLFMLTLEGSAASFPPDWLVADASRLWFSAVQINIEMELARANGESRSSQFRWVLVLSAAPHAADSLRGRTEMTRRAQFEQSAKWKSKVLNTFEGRRQHQTRQDTYGKSESNRNRSYCVGKNQYAFFFSCVVVPIFQSKAVFMWFRSFPYSSCSSKASLDTSFRHLQLMSSCFQQTAWFAIHLSVHMFKRKLFKKNFAF